MNATARLAAWGIAAALLALPACSRQPRSGPGPVRWDRDTCDRCRMALSDRHYSAQVRGGPVSDAEALHRFDDFGCAILWLDGQPWKQDTGVEVWVNDHRDGVWLDASKAWFLPNRQTPMDYGLAAQAPPADGALDYTQAVSEIRRVANERRARQTP